jgi:hypothetical protein
MRNLIILCIGASLALPASALADYGPKRGVYGGKATSPAGTGTNRVHPVSVTLSKNGKEIKLLRVTAPAPCSPSGSATTSPAWEEIKLARNGSFSDSDKFTVRSSDGSEVTKWTSTIRGQVGNRGGSGKARDKAVVRDPDGNLLRKCDTGAVRFNFKRSERVYGGSVKFARGFPAFGTVFPVSVERNRSGSKLKRFRIRYIAQCGSENHHTNSFEHSNIDVKRNGDFSESRKFSYRSSTGTKFKGTWTLRGQLGKKRAKGTYRAKFTAVLSNGDELPCDTGKRKWSAAQR